MEPEFHSGEIAWVSQQDTLCDGEIGIFGLNNEAYIKKLKRYADRLYLVSLNSKYSPIQISKKDIYHTPSGKYIQFIHDHSEKTFDAWELLPDGSHRLLESQSTTIETFDEFKQKIIGKN